MGGLIMNFLDPSTGIITAIIKAFTGQDMQVLTSKSAFVPMLVISDVYKGMGWGTIIYFAALSGVDPQLYEAASIDGCGYLRFFFSIVLPLSKAIVAVMALFYAARIWNGYFEALIYMSTEEKFPLQLILRTILIDSQNALQDSGEATTVADKQELVDLLKYGCVVVSSVPMLIFYPFVQKYFVKGVMIGAVKG